MTSATQSRNGTRLLFEEEQRFVGTWVMIPVLAVVVLGIPAPTQAAIANYGV